MKNQIFGGVISLISGGDNCLAKFPAVILVICLSSCYLVQSRFRIARLTREVVRLFKRGVAVFLFFRIETGAFLWSVHQSG